MSRADTTPTSRKLRFRWLRGKPNRLYLIIFLGFLVCHAIVFRDVIAAIPSVLSGDVSIVREELVPFFDIKTQFWGEGTSALTSSEEVRVSYSFWTAWMRHDKILPFAIVILNTVSAFILFYAFHRIGRYIYKKSLFGVLAAVLAAILVHTILLYAKMAHFYVLIIGFSMFALSLSLVCEQLFFKLKITTANVLAVSALTLFNPAIHYHVIFYFVLVLIIVIHTIFTLIMNKRFFWKYFWRSLKYLTLIVLLSLVPYVIYIFFTMSSSLSGVSTQIPVNYWMIYYASLALPYVFSLDTAGHLDLIRYGNYLTPIPRFGSMLVMFLIGSLVLFRRFKTLHIVIKVFILTLFIVMLFAMWMTIGYSENSPYSFHKVLGDIAIFFANIGGVIGSNVAGAIGTFINILRFPHRFQFIYFYAAGVLFMIALVWLREIFMRRFHTWVATGFVVAIALFPLVANFDYRTALASGDLATFVAPYRIPAELKLIKNRLATQKDRKIFILPTLEGGREIVQDGKRYSFLDKYLIYYLNQPTYYYGAGANTENKLISYLVYRAIAYNEPWWQDVLANNLGITDIVVPVTAVQRKKGINYLPDIENKIKRSLAVSTRYKQTAGGQDYALYSLNESRGNSSLLVDTEWKNTLTYLNDSQKPKVATFFPLQMAKFLGAPGDKQLLTDSIERSYYDFYRAFTKGTTTTSPNPVSLPFNSEYVASSNFTNNALSLSTLYAKNTPYNYLRENVPSLVNLQKPSFVGLTRGDSTLSVPLRINKAGRYRILLHAASKKDEVKARIDGRPITLNKIIDDRGKKGDYIDFSYFYADIDIKPTVKYIEIENQTTNAVLIDSVMWMPLSDVPPAFDRIQTSKFQIIPTNKELIYDIRMEK